MVSTCFVGFFLKPGEPKSTTIINSAPNLHANSMGRLS